LSTATSVEPEGHEEHGDIPDLVILNLILIQKSAERDTGKLRLKNLICVYTTATVFLLRVDFCYAPALAANLERDCSSESKCLENTLHLICI
jgi:hypothetical protein